jgi:hypothetical protein
MDLTGMQASASHFSNLADAMKEQVIVIKLFMPMASR